MSGGITGPMGGFVCIDIKQSVLKVFVDFRSRTELEVYK